MQLRHIVAATDESDAGGQAVRTALDLAERASARVTVLRVITAKAMARLGDVAGVSSLQGAEDDAPSMEHLRRWLATHVLSPGKAARVELGIEYGLPGIEICRFAERNQVDLIVVGRKRHSQRTRLLLEDTADAVARRSRLPVLFVPLKGTELRSVLVALDGSSRGLKVLEKACDFGRSSGSNLKVVTVERTPASEPLYSVSALPVARTSSLQASVRKILAQKGLPDTRLMVRHGCVVDEVLAAAAETNSDVLAIGYHRGGPSGVIEPGSTAQRLGHAASCAVLTVPL